MTTGRPLDPPEGICMYGLIEFLECNASLSLYFQQVHLSTALIINVLREIEVPNYSATKDPVSGCSDHCLLLNGILPWYAFASIYFKFSFPKA